MKAALNTNLLIDTVSINQEQVKTKKLWQIRLLEHKTLLDLQNFIYDEITDGLIEGVYKGIITDTERSLFIIHKGPPGFILSLHKKYIENKNKIEDKEIINLLIYYYHFNCHENTVLREIGSIMYITIMQDKNIYVSFPQARLALYTLLDIPMITDIVKGTVQGTVESISFLPDRLNEIKKVFSEEMDKIYRESVFSDIDKEKDSFPLTTQSSSLRSTSIHHYTSFPKNNPRDRTTSSFLYTDPERNIFVSSDTSIVDSSFISSYKETLPLITNKKGKGGSICNNCIIL